MAKSYMIMEIKGLSESLYGNTVAVMANPIIRTDYGNGHYSTGYNPSICSETELFIFPEDDDIIQPLLRWTRSRKAWEPKMEEYRVCRMSLDYGYKKFTTAFRHCSCFEEYNGCVVGEGNAVEVAPQKKAQLEQSYISYMRANYAFDSIDMQEYVARLADEDSNFFAWLFDDQSLTGCSLYELDEEQSEAWSNFYESLDPYQ